VNDIAIRLAERVRGLRIDAGLTQAELAANAGVTVETVARLERVLRGRSSANANPSLETLARLSEALGVELCELLDAPTKSRPRGGDDRLSLILKNTNGEVRRLVTRLAEVVARELSQTPPERAPAEKKRPKKRR
jgi:transcriptional regulator with XRE-family HTH domain